MSVYQCSGSDFIASIAREKSLVKKMIKDERESIRRSRSHNRHMSCMLNCKRFAGAGNIFR